MTLCGGVGGYDQLCCPASPKLMLGLDLGLGCDKNFGFLCDCNEVKIAELISRSYTQQFFQALGVFASLI